MGISSTIRGIKVKPTKTVIGTKGVRKVAKVVVPPKTPVATSIRVSGPVMLRSLSEALCYEDKPKTADTFVPMRASSAHKYCPRAHVIEHVGGEPNLALEVACGIDRRVGSILPIETAVTFKIGTAVHEAIQKSMGHTGTLLGQWWCEACATLHGGPHSSDWIAKPTKCMCGAPGESLAFHEAYTESAEYMMSGHCDGGIYLPDGSKAILEIKTISESQFNSLKTPLSHHVYQASIYAQIFGCEKIVFLYVSKGWHKGSRHGIIEMGKGGYVNGPLKEFVIDKNSAALEQLRVKLNLYRHSVNVSTESELKLPPKLPDCAGNASSSRCQECRVATECWSMA